MSETAELGLRTLAAGALLVWGASLALADGPRRVRIIGPLFCLAAISFAFNEHAPTRALIGWFGQPLWLLSVAGVGWFWLFMRVLFEDRPLARWEVAPPAVLATTGLIGWFGPDPLKPVVWVTHHALELGLTGHAAWMIIRSWRTDLIDSRRWLRLGTLAAMSLFIGMLAVLQVQAVLRPELPQPRLLLAGLFAAVAVAGAIAFVQPREGLVLARPVGRPAGDASLQDLGIVDKLRVQMLEMEVWREEGLTIGALAQKIGSPEHRVRAVINRRLGYGNFTRYLAEYRIKAAQALLQDNGKASRTIASIAFDVGFGSLGPFNRAFREVTGMTPTEWRREHGYRNRGEDPISA